MSLRVAASIGYRARVEDDARTDADGADLGHRLRTVVGDLVRVTRRTDTLAPIPGEGRGLLDRAGPLTTADLAARRGVRNQTMAATLAELVEAGWVAGSPHPADGRKTLLSLTDAGRQLLDAERDARAARLLAGAEAALTPAERRRLAAALPLLEKLTGALGTERDAG